MLTNCSALCCKEFVPGEDFAKVDFGVDAAYKDEFAVIAQAAGDMSAAASGALADVEVACLAIATDLGATETELGLTGATGDARVTAACNLAGAKIKAVMPTKIDFAITPAVCSASVKAQASCQGKCSVDGSCDIKANPPKCTGGNAKLEISCKGECTGSAGASIDCEGTCTGTCSGECRATGAAVDCNGRCEGTCQGSTDSQGNCNGKCNGSCKVTGGGLSCAGQCNGSCTATCKGSATVAVKCSGTCAAGAEYEPLRCTGGKLEGGCKVDAQCSASCDASLQAKAECTPPSVTIKSNASSEQVAALFATLERNLPALINMVQGRGEVFVNAAKALFDSIGTLAGNTDKLGVKGVACAGSIIEAAGNASAGATVALSASLSVTGAVGAK
jgi:hypothetical protein